MMTNEMLLARLAKEPNLYATASRAGVVVRIVRRIGQRGFLRIMRPSCVATVSAGSERPTITLRPDGLALFMVAVGIAACIIELTLDRARYPREYPAAFAYGLAAYFPLATAFDLLLTRARVARALGLSK